MHIETITETRTETFMVETYKTSDGKIFEKIWEAEDHQKELNIKALEEQGYLEVAAKGFAPYGDNFDADTYNYVWYKAKNQEAIKAINKIYGLDIPQKYENEWICVEEQNGEDEVYYYTLEEGKNDFSKLLEKLGYEIEIKEKN